MSQPHEQFSSLYTKKGTLIADAEFHINQKQIKKWRAIEDTVLAVIQTSLQYPRMCVEHGVAAKLICSMTVDKNGTIGDLRVEKQSFGGRPWRGSDTTYSDTHYFLTEIMKVLATQAGLLKQLSYSTKIRKRFYLPFDFVLFELQDRNAPVPGIYEGWLRLTAMIPPIIDVDQK